MFGFNKKTASSRNLRDAGASSASGGSDTPASLSSAASNTPRGGREGGGGREASTRFNPSTFALLAAAEQGQTAELTRLLNMRAGSGGGMVVHVNDRDHLGRTALHVAARHGHLDAVKLLVESHGADLNAVTLPHEGEVELGVASKESDDEETKARGRKSPLHMAIEAKRFEVAQYLLAKGACALGGPPGPRLLGSGETNVPTPPTTALHLAAANCPKEGDASTAKTFTDMVGMILMLLGGANHQDAQGNTGLHYAVDGESSLLLAIRQGRREIILAVLQPSTQATPSIESAPKPPVKEPELNLQKGWLKKKIQASDTKSKILKKWQKRFVEVRHSSLAYYKNQQQSAPAFEIELKKATILASAPFHKAFVGIHEITQDPNHPFVFAVRPQEKKKQKGDDESEPSGKPTRTLYFSANSEEELMQWVQSLVEAKKQARGRERDSTDPKFPQKVTAVMKRVAKYFEDMEQQREVVKDVVGLEETVELLPTAEGKDDNLSETAESQAGRRRSSFVPLYSPELWNAENADEKEIAALQLALRKMTDFKEASFDFGAVANPYSIFQFLVAVLKQLHVPLLTFKAEPSFLAAAALVDPAKRLEQYRTLLRTSVPSECVQRIRVLVPLLRRLEAHHARNGMTFDRLGDVFVPVFARGRLEKAANETTREKYLARTLLEDFVKHQERLFAEKPEEGKDLFTVQLAGEYAHFRRRVGSQGLLYLLDQEVEAIRLKWEEVKDVGKGESSNRAREWEKTIQHTSTLGEGVQAEMDANAEMISRMHVALAESRQAIEAVQPRWDTINASPSAQE